MNHLNLTKRMVPAALVAVALSGAPARGSMNTIESNGAPAVALIVAQDSGGSDSDLRLRRSTFRLGAKTVKWMIIEGVVVIGGIVAAIR